MKIFITGASGWIGSHLIAELIDNGHEAVGLARSEVSARAVEASGAKVYRGDIDDPNKLAEAAVDADGVIHLAFQHQLAFSGNFAAAAAADRAAVDAMGRALAGSEKPFVLASGILGMVSPGIVATENDGLTVSNEVRIHPAGNRLATALLALSFRGIGIRSSILRFPPTVHGSGDHGFMAMIVAAAKRHGVSGYVADGMNRWPAVHVTDAARLARLALESAPAGSVLHAVGEDGVNFRSIADSIAHRLNLPTTSLTYENAIEHFSPIGQFVGMDSPASATITKKLLGWEPTGPSLLEDLDNGHYTLTTQN